MSLFGEFAILSFFYVSLWPLLWSFYINLLSFLQYVSLGVSRCLCGVKQCSDWTTKRLPGPSEFRGPLFGTRKHYVLMRAAVVCGKAERFVSGWGCWKSDTTHSNSSSKKQGLVSFPSRAISSTGILIKLMCFYVSCKWRITHHIITPWHDKILNRMYDEDVSSKWTAGSILETSVTQATFSEYEEPERHEKPLKTLMLASGAAVIQFGRRSFCFWWSGTRSQRWRGLLTLISCSRLLTSSPSTCPVWATRMLRRSALRRRYCRMRQVLLACSSCSRSSCSWYTSSSWNMSRISSISQRSSSTSSCNKPHRRQGPARVCLCIIRTYYYTYIVITYDNTRLFITASQTCFTSSIIEMYLHKKTNVD